MAVRIPGFGLARNSCAALLASGIEVGQYCMSRDCQITAGISRLEYVERMRLAAAYQWRSGTGGGERQDPEGAWEKAN